MFNIRLERLIHKPINVVFDMISDHAKYSRFKAIDKSSLLNEGKHHKNGVGALREIVSSGGTLHELIVKYEPPSLNASANTKAKTAILGYRIVYSSPLPYEHQIGEITLTEQGESTLATWVSKGRIKIPLIGTYYFDKQIQSKGARAFGSILKHIDNM